jgi:hypothetical protein
MAHHPFADAAASRKSITNRRRSTRVDIAIPIVLSGRDASGHAFRDETHAVTINLHGARIQTIRQLLVGMQVTVESPRTQVTAKAICVRTDEPLPGVAVRYVAVQLVKPGNIWGLENPPEDWKLIEEAERAARQAAPSPVQTAEPAALTAAQVAALEQQAGAIADGAVQRLRGLVEEMLSTAFEDFQQRLDAQLAASEERVNQCSAGLEQQATSVADGAVERLRGLVEEMLSAAFEDFQQRLDAQLAAGEERIDKRSGALEQQATLVVDGAVNRLRTLAEETPATAWEDFQRRLDAKLAAGEKRIDERAAALERQSASVTDGAGERLRALAEETPAAALEDFQRRLDAKLAAGEARIDKRSDESFAELEEALKKFRADLEDELEARTAQAVASVEQALRAQLPALVSSILAPPATPSAPQKTDLFPRK